VAIAARLSKYGLTLEDVVWRLPLAVINQFLIYDDLASGRKPRWHTDGEVGAKTLDELFADALTAGF
jgi:hypothetical protein